MGSVADLVAAPTTPFVADFTGANLLTGSARAAGDGLTEVHLTDGIRIVSTDQLTGEVGAVVHPWEIGIARSMPLDSMQNHVRGAIESLVPVANRMRVRSVRSRRDARRSPPRASLSSPATRSSRASRRAARGSSRSDS